MTASRVPVRAFAEDTPEYRPDVVDNAIGPLYECIWRVAGPGAEAGFPDSLEAIRTVQHRVYPTSASPPENECAKQLDRIAVYPFDVEYVPRGRDASGRARHFTLTLTEKTRLGGRPKVVWIEDAGLRRVGVRASGGGAVDSVRLAGTRSLFNVGILLHAIDEHARQRGGEYPARIAPDWQFRDTAPPPSVLTAEVGQCGGPIKAAEDSSASCIERWERVMVYHPIRDASGRVSAYTLTMRPATYYDYEHNQPIPSRTHHRDARGALHSFGGYRSAIDTDPPPADDELASARAELTLRLERQRR
jgi:hypothetical protein